MNETGSSTRPKRLSLRLWLVVALAAAAFVGANAHLIYVATTSQPACVTHLRQGEGDAGHGFFSAAQSSCTPSPANAGHS